VAQGEEGTPKFANQERRVPRRRLGSTVLTAALIFLVLLGLAVAVFRHWR
jgi:hypothetical protein